MFHKEHFTPSDSHSDLKELYIIWLIPTTVQEIHRLELNFTAKAEGATLKQYELYKHVKLLQKDGTKPHDSCLYQYQWTKIPIKR